jgi:hypothetical protein
MIDLSTSKGGELFSYAHLTRLQRVTLIDTGAGLRRLGFLTQLANLQQLKLCNQGRSTFELEDLICKLNSNLRSLCLRKCLLLDLVALRNVSSLTHLELSTEIYSLPKDDDENPNHALPNLRSLVLNGEGVSAVVFGYYTIGTGLRSLHIFDNDMFYSCDRVLQHFTNLVSLHLSSDGVLATGASLSCLVNLTRLEMEYRRRTHTITDATFANLTKLRVLAFRVMPSLRGRFLPTLTQLQELYLNEEYSFTVEPEDILAVRSLCVLTKRPGHFPYYRDFPARLPLLRLVRSSQLFSSKTAVQYLNEHGIEVGEPIFIFA